MSRLEGKVAVITGANSGIGLAIAKRFAREGAEVYMTGRRHRDLHAAVREVGANSYGVQGDVTNLRDLDRLYDVVRERSKNVDILVANAGIGSFAPMGEITEEHYERTFSTNVKGTVFTVQKALPLLRKGGSVILIGSTAATTGTPAFSIYSASKAAIRSFARNWILDLAVRGIRVNVLAPGATMTPGWRDLAGSEEQYREMQAYSKAATPLHRLGSPEEIANAALFLASEESSYVTGSELFVDGGSAQV
jgi:NAD(P)-dependent dehydrogenase (short-subunit alcohol dehydrogenase family)